MRTLASTTRNTEKAPAHRFSRDHSRGVPERDNTSPVPFFSEHMIQRKASCACGGGCPACRAKSNDLRIAQPNDPTEIEADQIADRAMRMPAVEPEPVTRPNNDSGTIQRKCSECEDEDETIHRKPLPSVGSVPAQSPAHVQNAISSVGRSLERETRSFFEPRLGYDLSAVRIHMGGTAAESAKAIDARAYTLGSNIVFAAGEYRPDSESGQQLLAHELAHVAQHGWHSDHKAIHRCPDAASLTDFETRIIAIRALAEFTALPVADGRTAEDIITTIRNRDDCIFMAERLHVLLTTPVDQSPAVGAAASSTMATEGQTYLQFLSLE